MLIIKTKLSTPVGLTQHEFKCPVCGNIIAFFKYSPIRCHSCACLMTNVSEILTDSYKRILFHRTK